MPHIPHTVRRGARYHFRRRANLRSLGSQPITLSLRTADPKVARARAVRLAARWDEVEMIAQNQFATARPLNLKEIRSLISAELEDELALAIRDNVGGACLPAEYQDARRVMAEAYRIGGRLSADTLDLPEDEHTRLSAAGWTDADIGRVVLMLRALANPRLLAHATRQRLERIGAPICPATLADGVHHLSAARAEAQERAGHLTSTFVQSQNDPYRTLIKTSAAQLARVADGAAAVASSSPSNVPEFAGGTGCAAPNAISGADASPAPSVFLKPDDRRFSEIISETLNRIEVCGDWGKGGRQQRERVMGTFAWITGDKPLSEYSHLDSQAFVDALQRLPKKMKYGTLAEGPMSRPFEEVVAELPPLTAQTRRNMATVNRDLAIMSRVEGELHKSAWKPASGNARVLDFGEHRHSVKRPGPNNPKRMPWTAPHLRVLFGLPIFTGTGGGASCRLRPSTYGVVSHDAAYWLPLLALYTHCSRNELAGLESNDVVLDGEVPYFFIRNNMTRSLDDETEEGEKTENRCRKIPIHPELRRLGFLEYLGAIKAEGHEALFPELYLPGTKTTGGKKFYKAWQPMAMAVDNALPLPRTRDGKKADFHSIRTYSYSHYAKADIRQTAIDDLFGHARTETGPVNYERAADVLGDDQMLRDRLALMVDNIVVLTAGLQAFPIRLLPLARRSLVGTHQPRQTRSDKGKTKGR